MSTSLAQPAADVRSSAGVARAEEGVQEIRPAGRSVIVIAFGWLVLASMFAIVCFAALMWGKPEGRFGLLLLPIVIFLIVLSIAAVVRKACLFQLTPSRVNAARGVFRRSSVEARLDDVRNVTVGRSLVQRVLGLGTIRMTTAGVGPSVVWNHVDQPGALADQVRAAIDAARSGGSRGENAVGRSTGGTRRPISPPVPTPATPKAATARLPVIGLAGGIGAGKSSVAAAFERLGCFVIDSDVRAKAALDRPDVRDALVSWWGPGILSADGRVDRGSVGAIVFSNAAERERLEGLVHPIVREDRARMVQDAAAAGAKAAIVDAPLLFEAGVDAECDCAVFVDAPREVRLERVRRSRGWDEAELDRREAAQMPLDLKRARCRFIVDNNGDASRIEAHAARILAEVSADPTSGSQSGGTQAGT